MCERSFAEAAYPRYPRLPVLKCEGYAAVTGRDPDKPVGQQPVVTGAGSAGQLLCKCSRAR